MESTGVFFTSNELKMSHVLFACLFVCLFVLYFFAIYSLMIALSMKLVHIVKNCYRGEVQGPRSQFFTIRTDLKPVNNLLIFPSSQMKKKKLTEKNSRKRYCDCVTNQSDCRIRYRARLEKKHKYSYLQN